MSNIINADNGVVSGIAGVKLSSDSTGVLDIQTNGTTAITISTAQVVSLTNSPTFTGGTANGVLYLNASKVATSGSALVFDGTDFATTGGVRLNNSQYYYGKNAAGTAVRLLGVNSGNVNYVGSIDSGPTEVNYGAASTITTQYWNISGSESMRLNATGLGIGTASPGYKLDVNTTGGSAATARLNGNDQSNVRLRLENGGSGGRTWELVGGLPGANNANFSIRDVTGSTTPLTIDSSGNLGLGATTITAIGGGIRTLAFQDTNGAGIRFYGGATEYGRMYAVSSAMYIDAVTAIPMLFSTNNTERARITSGGAFFVGTTTGLYTAAGSINSVVSTVNDFCFAGSNSNSTNPRGLYLRNTNTTAGDYAIYFEASAATKFYVNGNGVIYSTNTSVQSVSDARHKENVRDLDKGLTEVLALKPRRFDWKEGKGTGAKDVAGFIAQEVESVLPELIGEWKESIDAKEKFKSIGMTNVIPMLVKAIQEQQAIITQLTARITALEGT